MNLLLLQESDRVVGAGSGVGSASRFRVGGRRAGHLIDVLGAAPGRTLRAGLLDGPLGTATVVHVSADDGCEPAPERVAGLETGLDPDLDPRHEPKRKARRKPKPDPLVELDCVFEAEPPPRPRTDLLLAIPRPSRLVSLLPEIAALGVDRIVLLRTWRVQKSYLTSKVLRPDVHRRLLWDGLEQARCTREPSVRIEPLFQPYIQDRAAAEFANGRRIVLHPGSGPPLSSLALRPDERVCLAIGPEGGFREFEVELLVAAGFEAAQLGSRTLRVDTAVVAGLATILGARVRSL